MARVSYDVRRTLGVTKYDATPNLVYLDTRDESPPVTAFDLTSFLNGEIALGDNTFPGRDHNGDKNGFIHSQSPLSVLARGKTNPNQQCDDSIRKIDANLLSLLNPGEGDLVKKRDQKTTDFTDSLLASEKNSMKIKDNSESGVGGLLSDFISVSIQEYNPSVRKGYGRSISPVCNISLNDISIPEFMKVDENANAPEDPSGKKCIASSEPDFNLSDILSSICIDDQSNSKSSNESSLQSCDQSLCLDDFNIIGDINEQQLTGLNVKVEDLGINIGPNCLSSFDFSDAEHEAASQRNLSGCEILDNDTKYLRNRLKSSSENSNGVGFSFFEISNKQVSLNGINIQDLIEDVNTRNANNLGTSLDSNKSTGFSFFCDPSENQLTFSQMFDDNTDITPQSDSSCDQDSISMLDLYNSLQSSKEGTSASESNSFSSDEIEKEGDSTSLSSDDDDQVMVAIDLSTCIKSFEDKSSFNPTLQVTEIDVTNPNLQSTPEHIFHGTHILSMPLKNTVSSQAPRMNLQQSLFAKALSCKSKKDPSLVHKIANIKAELFNIVFGCPMPVKSKNCSPQIETATYSDKPITQCNCRRVFGQIEVGVSPVR